MKKELSIAVIFLFVMGIAGCGGTSEKKGTHQQEPSTTTDTATAANTGSNLAVENQQTEQRVAEIQQWNAEVQAMGLKNCKVKKRVKMDGLESPDFPFEQVVKTCKLTSEYELVQGKFPGYEQGHTVNIYKKNGKIFFVFVEGGAESFGFEETYYCDQDENVIRFLKKETSMEDEKGSSKEEKLNPNKPKIQDYIQLYLEDIQYVMNARR